MNAIEKVKSALRRLNLSDNEQTVYLALLRDGQTTARVLTARTGLTRPSVYDQLKSLKKRGLVIKLDIENVTHFAAADLKHLEALLEDKIDHLEQSRDFLKAALPTLADSLKTVDPKLRYFEGEDGMKQLLKEVMWHDHLTMRALWPDGELRAIYDEKFLHWFDDRRQKRDISIYSLWPQTTKPSDRLLFSSADDKQKSLPKKLQPSMGYLIFANKVAFISSNTEAFGFIVESKEFRALQEMHFDALWF